MSLISINKSKYLTNMLTELLASLNELNKSDKALNQVASQIKELIMRPQIDSHDLIDSIKKAKEIVESYGIKPKGQKPGEGVLDRLPFLFYAIIEEIENVAEYQRLTNKLSTASKLDNIKKKLVNYHRALK